jgi:DNA-directed RNA polymerase subunit RPC12/RpoP
MEPMRRMEWTCPKCRTRNASPVPRDTADGKLLPVACQECGARCYATAILRGEPGRQPSVYGVAWV